MVFHPRRAKVARIREELSCFQCGYSLRGVPGDVGTCPECGVECDLTRMIVNQWTGPWYHAPKFNQVLAPLTTVSLGVWGVLIVLAVEMGLQRTPTYTALAAGVLAVAWLVLMWRLRNLMLDGAAMGLALLAHGIFAGYAVSLAGGEVHRPSVHPPVPRRGGETGRGPAGLTGVGRARVTRRVARTARSAQPTESCVGTATIPRTTRCARCACHPATHNRQRSFSG